MFVTSYLYMFVTCKYFVEFRSQYLILPVGAPGVSVIIGSGSGNNGLSIISAYSAEYQTSVWVVLIEKCIQLVKIPSKISPLLKKKMVKLAKLALFEAMDIIVKDVYKL
jgi:threonine synthase